MVTGDRTVFFGRHGPLQTAPMHSDAKPCGNRVDTLRHGDVGLCRLKLIDIGEDFGGELVAAFWPPLPRYEPDQTVLGQGALGFVEGWSRHAKDAGDVADGHAIDPMTAHHLVADLHQVVGIEEGIIEEQGIAHGLGVGVEGAVAG